MDRTRHATRLLPAGLGLAVVLTGCGDDTPAATSTTAPPTTTAVATTQATTTTTEAPTALDKLGYPVSDEYLVETVVTGIEAGTGGLAVAPDGTMYQADFGYPGHFGDTVYRIDPDGTVTPLVESDEMKSLTMTTFGPDGRLYQSSYGSDRVFTIDADGTFETVAEGIQGPTGLVVLEDGTVVVEAFDSGIIHKVLPDGTVTDWVRDAEFNGINGLAQDPDGVFYVANFRDGALFSVDQEGAVTRLHEFPKATAHVAYLDGSLFVTSRLGYVVFRYDLATGATEIVAGDGEPGDRDGRGGEASFGRPNAITVGPDGALYINHADGSQARPVTIRKISRAA